MSIEETSWQQQLLALGDIYQDGDYQKIIARVEAELSRVREETREQFKRIVEGVREEGSSDGRYNACAEILSVLESLGEKTHE